MRLNPFRMWVRTSKALRLNRSDWDAELAAVTSRDFIEIKTTVSTAEIMEVLASIESQLRCLRER